MLSAVRPRNLWNRFIFRDVAYNDNHGAFKTAYIVPDPYNLKSEQAAYRFAETNRIIRDVFGPVGTMLEIGCAEGYQSRHLLPLCDSLHGIDVSDKAVERARVRCPEVRFSDEDIFALTGRYDLVLAAEVLYYMSDIPAVIARMSALGAGCLVTYYEPASLRLDPHFANIPGVQTELLQYKDVRWKAVWWKTG
jgi:2-polyprenyl-3-methyl-5-hydroxy-6-metoxy-1,4-benzoquinol methylase